MRVVVHNHFGKARDVSSDATRKAKEIISSVVNRGYPEDKAVVELQKLGFTDAEIRRMMS